MRWRNVPLSAVALSAFFVGAQKVRAEEEMVEANQMSAEQIEALSAMEAPAAKPAAAAPKAAPTPAPIAETVPVASPAVAAEAAPPEEAVAPMATEPASSTPVVASETEAEPVRDPARDAIAIQTAAFESEGFWMNAFYFVRTKGETWNQVSEKIYGRPDRADLLRKWNHHVKLKVGQVVYYNSPTRPDDSSAMKVFAEDFGYQLEEIKVKKGDTLSKIGKARYGSIYSWKEISALNPELPNPDKIEVGQVIRVQPVNVDTQPVLHDIISTVKKEGDPEVAPVSGQSEQIPEEVPLADAVQQKAQTAPTNALPPPADFTPPPTDTAANTAAATAGTVQEHSAPATIVKKSSEAISFKTSSLLGLMGTALLVLSLGMIITRKVSKARAQKSDSLASQLAQSNRKSPV